MNWQGENKLTVNIDNPNHIHASNLNDILVTTAKTLLNEVKDMVGPNLDTTVDEDFRCGMFEGAGYRQTRIECTFWISEDYGVPSHVVFKDYEHRDFDIQI